MLARGWQSHSSHEKNVDLKPRSRHFYPLCTHRPGFWKCVFGPGLQSEPPIWVYLPSVRIQKLPVPQKIAQKQAEKIRVNLEPNHSGGTFLPFVPAFFAAVVYFGTVTVHLSPLGEAWTEFEATSASSSCPKTWRYKLIIIRMTEGLVLPLVGQISIFSTGSNEHV